MARNRQRAKQRQAARRAARLEQGGGPAGADGGHRADDPVEPGRGSRARETEENGRARDELLAEADLAVGAPPEAAGRSDTLFGGDQGRPEGVPDADELDDAQAASLEREAESEPLAAPPDPDHPDRAGHIPADARHRNRIVAFLLGCWAELQRVQWPNRTQLFTLTGVVLGFVVIAGGYLGALDFVFYRLIRAILF
jgi:preprotein translocase SecE subunit